MTCRCGYEMCWRCGGNYTKVSRPLSTCHSVARYAQPTMYSPMYSPLRSRSSHQGGRRGHNFTLFPRPSELPYCCNDTKMWAKRCAIVVAAAPVAAVGVCVGAAAAVTL